METVTLKQYQRIVFLAFAVVTTAIIAMVAQFSVIVAMGEASIRQVFVISSTAMMFMAGLMMYAVSKSRVEIAEVRRMAFLDELTGLINRRHFNRELIKQLKRSRKSKKSTGVLILDLDRFKTINDCHGHDAGDSIIKQFGSRIKSAIATDDTLCRISGDEFSILLRDVQSEEDIYRTGEQILKAMKEPFLYEGRHIYAGLSMGGVIVENGESDASSTMRMADFALMHSKENGRNRMMLFNPEMEAEIRHRGEMEIQLREAIATNALSVRYQPLVNQHGGMVSGVEALIRWTHSEAGEISPGEFLPLAQELALMDKIGEFVLERACTEIGPIGNLRLAVNISPMQFLRDNFVEKIEEIVQRTKFDPNRLELEISQELLAHHADSARAKLSKLRDLGINIALDDFGTGYSGMFFLREFQLDRIKLDRTFVAKMQEVQDGPEMVDNMIGLARTLSGKITIEGIETEDQLAGLQQSNANELQGFLFSKPLTAIELRASKLIEGLEEQAKKNEQEDEGTIERQSRLAG